VQLGLSFVSQSTPFAFVEEFAGDALQAQTGFKVDWILRFQRNPMIIEPVGKNM
jgi:hypothetical protein